MKFSILLLLLVRGWTAFAAARSPDDLRRAACLWDELTAPPTCAERLTERTSRARWLRGLGPSRRAIRSSVNWFDRLEGRTLADPEFQSLLDASIFDVERRPILLTGRIGDGKTMHLRALERFLAARGREYVVLTDRLWWKEKPEDPVRLELNVRAPEPLASSLREVPRAWLISNVGVRQQVMAAGIMKFLEVNRARLRNVVVIVDPSITTAEHRATEDLPTTLNLLDRLVWLAHTSGIRFVIATTPEIFEDHAARAAWQGTDPGVMAEYRRLSLEDPPADPRLDELKAMFPDLTVREIHGVLRDFDRAGD